MLGGVWQHPQEEQEVVECSVTNAESQSREGGWAWGVGASKGVSSRSLNILLDCGSGRACA